jgi:hypothetical protein
MSGPRTSEQFNKLFQRKARLEIQAQAYGDVVRGLSSEQAQYVEHIELKGHHRFGSEATILLKAFDRADVAFYTSGPFVPQGLDSVELRDGGRAIVTKYTNLGAVVRSRVAALPFLYSLVQVRKRARRTVTWACKLSNTICVAVECDIINDRAEFKLEHVDDVAHNQVLFRRVPNEWLPEGPQIETRGMDWSAVKDVPASVTVWWPYSHEKFDNDGEAVPRLPDLAQVALEIRKEAHANDSQR